MRLELLDKLADDNLAEIHMGRLLTATGPRLVTVRRLFRQTSSSPEVVESLRAASDRVMGIQHPHILPHLGFFEAEGDYYWLTARTLGFDVEQVMVRLSSREVRITPLRTLQLGMDMLEGLAALHSRNEIFTGLGPRQVVVGFDGMARIDALGFESALLANKELKKKARRGRTGSLAPEIVQGRTPAPASDVFSAAAVLYTLLTGRSPLGEKQRGGGMSTRHVAVKPPSKLERSLPYACDAVFVKALAVAPSGRHKDASSLLQSIASLRRTLVQGADEGRAGVKDFIENLFPNEASVVGMPGSLERPAVGEGIELGADGVVPAALPGPLVQSAGFSDLEPTDQHRAEEITRTETVQAPAPGSSPGAEAQGPVEADDSTWTYEGEDEEPSVTQKSEGVGPGWTAPPDTQEIPAATERTQPTSPGGVATAPPAQAKPELPDMAEQENQPSDTTETPAITPEDLGAPPRRDTDVMPALPDLATEDPDGKTDTDRSPLAPSAPDSVETPLWRRPSSLIAMALVSAALVFTLMYLLGGADSDPDVTLAGPPSDATSFIGFLSVQGLDDGRVMVDGELLPGETPLDRAVVKAGKHRVVIKDEDGKKVFDKSVIIQAGKQSVLDLENPEASGQAGAEAPGALGAEITPELQPQGEQAGEADQALKEVDAILAKPPVKVKPKAKARRVRRRRRKKSRRRSRKRKRRRKRKTR